ncbi:hypothetical protein HYX16_03285 [Candidatus Woesearchaeota archaeon]|nr:hypothetical protein [Candidatus Woesearchaeota archaeon]
MTGIKRRSLDKLVKEMLNIGLLAVSFGLGALFGASIFNENIPTIYSGTITKKKHSPERIYEVTMHIPVKTDGRTSWVYKKISLKDDEDYTIQFKQYVNGLVKSREIFVSREIFDSVKLGDFLDTTVIPYEDRSDDELIEPK